MQMAEGVRKATVQKLAESFPLLVRKAGTAPVGGGIFQVDLFVGNVQIAAEDHRFPAVQPHQELPKLHFPNQPMIQPGKTPLGIGSITGDQIKFIVYQRNQPAFGIQLRNTDAVGHLPGLMLGKHRCAGITLLFGIIPILVIPGKLQVQLTFL